MRLYPDQAGNTHLSDTGVRATADIENRLASGQGPPDGKVVQETVRLPGLG